MAEPSLPPYNVGDLPGRARRSAPAALHNVGPIGDVLAEWLPAKGMVLEIASGTGQHAIAFARRFPALTWQPSDVDPLALDSIAAWRASEGSDNLLPPVALDAGVADWPVEQVDVVLSINMVHIAPWDCARGLVAGAARSMTGAGQLILYGPWWMDGMARAPSNAAFDDDLRSRNPAWGIRRVEDFVDLALERDFELMETRPMPANNLMLRLRRTGQPSSD